MGNRASNNQQVNKVLAIVLDNNQEAKVEVVKSIITTFTVGEKLRLFDDTFSNEKMQKYQSKYDIVFKNYIGGGSIGFLGGGNDCCAWTIAFITAFVIFVFGNLVARVIEGKICK